jgi:hypothetical protein
MDGDSRTPARAEAGRLTRVPEGTHLLQARDRLLSPVPRWV